MKSNNLVVFETNFGNLEVFGQSMLTFSHGVIMNPVERNSSGGDFLVEVFGETQALFLVVALGARIEQTRVGFQRDCHTLRLHLQYITP